MCYTPLWNHACNDPQFFQNFQDKPRNFNGGFTKAFPRPCLFFFLEQTKDRRIDLFWVLRYPAYCTGLELLPEPPQNIKSVADYIQKCVFLLFPNNLLICNVKVLILLLPTSSATCRLFSCIFYECISIDVPEKVYVILCNLIGQVA